MSDQLLSVRDLCKTFRVPGARGAKAKLCALDGINLDLARGETLGLVGESGCGKSTLARTLLMLERPDSGTVSFDGTDPFGLRGKELLKFRRRVQMVFQDPYASLNSRMTAGDIIAEPWRTHRTLHPSKGDRDTRVRGLLDLVGLGAKATDKYPQEFSADSANASASPGRSRSIRTSSSATSPCRPSTLSVQAQVLNLLNDLQRQLQISYVFISHDLSVVRHVADRVAVMYLGRMIENRSHRSRFRPAESPLHRGADVGGTQAGRGATRRAHPAHWRGALAAEPAVGLSVPDQVPAGHRRLRQGTAAGRARSAGRRAHRRVPPSVARRSVGAVPKRVSAVDYNRHRGRDPVRVMPAGVDRLRHGHARGARRRDSGTRH